jgi:type I restriction enzyme S subunit
LRFKKFEGAWVKKLLGEVTIKINSGKTPLGGEATYLKDGVLFIRSQNVINDGLELKNSVFISTEVNNEMKNSVVKANDILLNITGASLGRSCVVPADFEIGNVNQHVCIIRVAKGYNPRYIQPILSSVKGQSIFVSLQTGSGREGLNFSSIKGISIYFPSTSEQDKIADFLSLIDYRIATQIKIIEELKSLKRELLQKIFSQKVRFKSDKGNDFPDWDVKKIGEVLKIGNGKDYKHLNKGDIPVFGTGGFMTSVDAFLNDGETVCIGRKGTIDSPFYFNGKIWTVDTLFYTHSFKNVIPKFIFYAFLLINWKQHNEASGVPSLSKSTIEKISIAFPSDLEQRKIADFLSVIDEKIDDEGKLLQQYDNQKKYLLKNLFI